jgi:hypothetical protein
LTQLQQFSPDLYAAISDKIWPGIKPM